MRLQPAQRPAAKLLLPVLRLHEAHLPKITLYCPTLSLDAA